jgi:hypothetical protein
VEVSGPQRMMTRNEWDRLQYEYFQRLIDENRGQKRQVHRAAQVVVAVPMLDVPMAGKSGSLLMATEKAAACSCGGRVSVFGEGGGGNDAGDEAED